MPPLTPTSIIEKLFKVDPAVGRVILIGLAVLAAVALVGTWGVETGDVLDVVLWLAVCYVLFAFLANMPGWLGTLLGTAACLALVAYVSLFAVQLITINRFNPPLLAAQCFFSPGQRGCPLQVLPETERTASNIATAEVDAPEPDAATPPVRSAPSAAPEGIDPAAYQVFVQYYPRQIGADQAMALATGLASDGWPVAADVEALNSAFGLNEVRYFHAEDADAAKALAAEVPGAATWVVEMRVRDFTHVRGAAPGLLEVWVGGG